METLKDILRRRGCDTFLNFLRGMETLFPNGLDPGAKAFLNFLRGMETEFNIKYSRLIRLLPKLP